MSDLQVASHLQHLYKHLLDNGFVRNLDLLKEEHLKIYSHEVLEMIRSDDDTWRGQVPDNVACVIRDKCLFS